MSDISRLLAGFRSFRTAYFDRRPEVYGELARRGQKPTILIIACSDSRVDPAILFGAEPGDMFVVRNVANLVPPYQPDGMCHGTSAAIEFAVRDLAVSHAVVLGHSSCGGIKSLCAAAHGAPANRDFIAPWMALAAPADPALGDDARARELAAIRGSVANLGGFPWVAEAVTAGRLTLHGWWFDIETGALWALDAETGDFHPTA